MVAQVWEQIQKSLGGLNHLVNQVFVLYITSIFKCFFSTIPLKRQFEAKPKLRIEFSLPGGGFG